MSDIKFNALTLDKILQTDDRPIVPMHIEAWGGDIFLQVMSGKERDEFEDQQIKMGVQKHKNVRARLIALCVCTQDGERIFQDSESIKKLGDKSSSVLDKIFEKTLEINLLGPDDIEDLAKNSNGDQSADSGTR